MQLMVGCASIAAPFDYLTLCPHDEVGWQTDLKDAGGGGEGDGGGEGVGDGEVV